MYIKRIAKENSLNRKEMIKNFGRTKGQEKVKIWVNTSDFPPLEFSELCQ